MEVSQVNAWLYQVSMSTAEGDRLFHASQLVGVDVTAFIHVAVLSHIKITEQRSGLGPTADLGDEDNG